MSTNWIGGPDGMPELTEQDYKNASVCEGCGRQAWVGPEAKTDNVLASCSHNCCTLITCLECNYLQASFGPAGCPCGCADAAWDENERRATEASYGAWNPDEHPEGEGE